MTKKKVVWTIKDVNDIIGTLLPVMITLVLILHVLYIFQDAKGTIPILEILGVVGAFSLPSWFAKQGVFFPSNWFNAIQVMRHKKKAIDYVEYHDLVEFKQTSISVSYEEYQKWKNRFGKGKKYEPNK